MGKELKPVQLCCHTPADKHSEELLWCMVHDSSSQPRWEPAAILMYQHKDYSIL